VFAVVNSQGASPSQNHFFPGAAMPDTFTVEIAEPQELRAAFCLLFQQSPLGDRQRGVEGALNLLERGELAPDGVLVVRDGDWICGVVLYSLNAGATGQIWPPQALAGYPQEALEDILIAEAVNRLRQGGSKFIQALLTEDDLASVLCLMRGGFAHVSSLLTLSHALTIAEDHGGQSTFSPALHYQTYAEADEGLFCQIMERTHEGSLDFPELNGLRTVDEAMDAHRRHGTFHAEQWLLAWRGDMPVGLLLLVEMPDQEDWELSYVGVVPEARKSGVGRELVREAVRRAAQLGTHRLTLTVDTRNTPAWNLYASEGFLPLDEHFVYMLIPVK
jgi:ribosomal protein S18 acetylase RimI-like enzyme